MLTEGQIGAVPNDYPLFRAARWLKVAPWDLYEQSVYWQQRANMFEAAEAEAEQARAKQQEGAS